MAAYAPDDFHEWFPPGLDDELAQAIADDWWEDEPHLAAALAWEAYAATLPIGPNVSSVHTGSQIASFNPPAPSGEAGAALAKASWHRSMLGRDRKSVV